MDFEKETWTAQQMTIFYEVSRKTLSQWVRRGMPKDARGKYPALKCFRWWRKFVLGQVDGENTDLTTERLLRERARRRLDELRTDEKLGSLVNRDQAVIWLNNIIIEAKQAFMNFARRMAPVVAVLQDEKEVEHELSQEIKKILRDLASHTA